MAPLRPLITAALVLSCLLFGRPPRAGADGPVAVPGTQVRLVPPPSSVQVGSFRMTDTPIRLYPVVLVHGDAYFIVQGLVGSGKAARALRDFRAVARTLTSTR